VGAAADAGRAIQVVAATAATATMERSSDRWRRIVGLASKNGDVP
jgi:hypothetical protein